MTETTTPRLRMPRFLGGSPEPTAEVISIPPKVENLDHIARDIISAMRAVEVQQHEVQRAEGGLDFARTNLLARQAELTELRQALYDECLKLGVALPTDDSHG